MSADLTPRAAWEQYRDRETRHRDRRQLRRRDFLAGWDAAAGLLTSPDALRAEVERLRVMLGEVPPPFVREPETLDEARQKIGGLRGALAEAIVERNAARAELAGLREELRHILSSGYGSVADAFEDLCALLAADEAGEGERREYCGLGICAALEGHEGTCAEASGWSDVDHDQHPTEGV